MLRFVCVLLLVGLVASQEFGLRQTRFKRRFGPVRGAPAQFNDEPPAEASGPEKPPPKPIAIIRQINENKGDGTYTFSYETENGISAEESGRLDAGGEEGIQRVKGAFSYLGPDNIRYTVTYTADENGFQPKGDHLPTSPPIPPEILKALKENAAEEAAAAAAAAAENNASGGQSASGPTKEYYQFFKTY